MARTILDNKTVLVAGADTPVGRAASLQFARAGMRVLLAGDDAEVLKEINELIARKKGEAFVVMMPESAAELATVLRHERDRAGHLHIVANTCALVGEHGEATALEVHRVTMDLAKERGFCRFLVLWPDSRELNVGAAPEQWRSIVRVGPLAMPGDESATGLRPAAVADALVCLSQCPPSACPVEVSLKYCAAQAEKK